MSLSVLAPIAAFKRQPVVRSLLKPNRFVVVRIRRSGGSLNVSFSSGTSNARIGHFFHFCSLTKVTRVARQKGRCEVKVDDEVIEQVDEMKYLGVMMSSDGSIEKEVEEAQQEWLEG